MGQNRNTRAPRRGPVKSCQKLVTRDGTISSDAAESGDIIAPSTPMATVGNPMPVTPFTIPARTNTAAMIPACRMEKPIIVTLS